MSVFRIKYNDRDGKKRETRNWHIEFKDHRGRRQRIPGFKDKPASRELERRIVKLAALRASGVTPDDSTRKWIEGLAPALRDRLAACDLLTAAQLAVLRPLDELLGEWEGYLRGRGNTDAHVRLVTSRAKKVFTGAGAKHWSEIDPTRVERFLQDEREGKDGISVRTSNFYLAAARQFSRWAVRNGVASEDSLRVLRPLDVQNTQHRRALTAQELSMLLATTAKGPSRDGSTGAKCEFGIPGPERALLYRMASETGLRRNELKTLRVADLDTADTERAFVNVRATNTKNRREAHLPLRPDLAAALQAHVRSRLPAARVFTVPKDFRAASMLRADLEAAEIAYADDAGRVVDFHSLRVTFATNLARGGVALQLAQRLLRHSTPVLTANVYTVLGRDDDRAAIDKLPDVMAAPRAEAVRATGTDAAPATPPTRTSRARRNPTQVIDEPPSPASPPPASPSPSPTDPRLAALISAWNHLDEQARGALVRTAAVMARGS